MKQKLKFYDIKAKKAFETDSYEVVEKQTSRGPMLFAVVASPFTGVKVYRLLGRKKIRLFRPVSPPQFYTSPA
jgi:hypothetical protein